MSAPFFTRRFELDAVIERGRNRGGEFYVGPFRSFWVSDASNSTGFKAELVVNPSDNSERGLPLRLNQCQSFGNKAMDAIIEVPVAQAGAWIEITFSQDENLSVGSVSVALSSGLVTQFTGSSAEWEKKTVTATPALLIPSDSLRLSATLQHKSGGSIWFGSLAACSDPDYKNMTTELRIGDEVTWTNTSGVYARTDTGSTILSLLQEKQ